MISRRICIFEDRLNIGPSPRYPTNIIVHDKNGKPILRNAPVKFFQSYQNVEKLAPLMREIGWSHNIVIMERCSDPLEREFYIRMTRKFGWSKNVLVHQIET
ncbi:DUF1016 N-terminal domain-containing protein [Desulfosarcina ovata]|uniref:DUF1016 N-terminal domain-containing protein n=1 Tax=Desulfosarcina ovata TaxID=83564 RepID=UPI0012D30401|nr:DUF1016 N-terminal domain-containing protein [Desulfosarcina ovata]